MESISSWQHIEQREVFPTGTSHEVVPTTLMDTKLGGDRQGGEMTISVDNQPVVSRDEGFNIAGLPADLLAVIEPGADGMQINSFGLVRTRLAGNASEKDDVLLVNLIGNVEEGFAIEEDIATKKPLSTTLQQEKTILLGRDSGNSYGDLRVKRDPGMSGSHLSVHLSGNEIVINDTKSLNGTEITSIGTPDNFTQEDLDTDISDLRKELGLKTKEEKVANVGNSALKALGVNVEHIDNPKKTALEQQQEKIRALKDTVPEEAWTSLFQYASQKARIAKLVDEGKDHRFMQNELSRASDLEKRIPQEFHRQAADLAVHFVNVYKLQK